MANIVPRNFWNVPTLADVADDLLAFPQTTSNISISEDDKNVYVEASVPGMKPPDIDVTYDHGVLWIRGETNQEEKSTKRKYYTRASQSFSYKVVVPGEIAQNAQPEATCENGVVMVTFPKAAAGTPKKISVKSKGEKFQAGKVSEKK